MAGITDRCAIIAALAPAHVNDDAVGPYIGIGKRTQNVPRRFFVTLAETIRGLLVIKAEIGHRTGSAVCQTSITNAHRVRDAGHGHLAKGG